MSPVRHRVEAVLAVPHGLHALLLNLPHHPRAMQLMVKVAHVPGLGHRPRQPRLGPVHHKADLRSSSHYRGLSRLENKPGVPGLCSERHRSAQQQLDITDVGGDHLQADVVHKRTWLDCRRNPADPLEDAVRQ
eukprot:1209105-Pyramimonas_sp.AAC.1